MKNLTQIFLLLITSIIFGQANNDKVWTADNGDGTYKNPIINSDYSDPDVIRVGEKYYMTASSFNCVPALPILESDDLVNWKLITYALKKLPPFDVYDKPQHGNGVWAPCIRYHKKSFYIFFPDPDFGIYMTHSKSIDGNWSDPVLVKQGKGLIDPAPFWDDDGKTYLTYAFAGSRAGIKSMLVVCTMSYDGSIANNDEVLLIDGHLNEPTIEGPKVHKRNNFYYIFAPAGGVSTGWQTVLRAKNIFGPYEKKKVLEQGKSNINGPHQGAWVQTQKGEDWFFHFQDKGTLGRVVHLQPMKWVNDWPVIGNDFDNDGIGEPVFTYKKPNISKKTTPISLESSDEFNETKLGLQWQWHANPKINWGFPSSLGYLMLNCIPKPSTANNLFEVPNLLLQKFPADAFTIHTKVSFNAHFDDEEAGFVIMGLDYCTLKIKQVKGKLMLMQTICKNAEKKELETETAAIELKSNQIYLQIKVDNNQNCNFFYSENNIDFQSFGTPFIAKKGKWIGAKFGFFALRNGFINDAGNLMIDWIRVK